MAEMRTWLDHSKIQPDNCRYSKGTPASTVRLEFKIEEQATRFAKAFGGRVLGSSPPAYSGRITNSKAAQEDAIASDYGVPAMS
jgi:hypothetical protein